LAGNIGYLDLRGFAPPQFMGDTAAAAMNFLANTDAVIIDLRQNGGGSPDAVAPLASYLMGPQHARMNDIYNRESNQTHQFWTLPYVLGKRLTGKDVYLLGRDWRGSGCEGLCRSRVGHRASHGTQETSVNSNESSHRERDRIGDCAVEKGIGLLSGAALVLRYSARSATIGSTRAARRAGT